jgi:hypothetical protein
MGENQILKSLLRSSLTQENDPEKWSARNRKIGVYEIKLKFLLRSQTKFKSSEPELFNSKKEKAEGAPNRPHAASDL